MPSQAFKPQVAFYLSEIGSGGVERILLKVARALAEKEYAVEVVAADGKGEFGFLLDGLPFYELARADYLRSRIALWRADPQLAKLAPYLFFSKRYSAKVLSLLPSLAGYLANRQPQVLITATPFRNIEAVLARRLAGVVTRLVLSEHSYLSVNLPKIQRRLRLLVPAMRRAYPEAEAIVAVSQGIAEDLVNLLGFPLAQLKVIYNPVVDKGFEQRLREPPEHPWFIDKSLPLIVTIGRLARQKGYPTLLQAFARLRQERPCRLAVIGTGEASVQNRLNALIGELGLMKDVAFLGFKPNPIPYLARADLFVLSSLWEGLPTALIEALACGTPVVSTACPSGPSEILEGGRYGRLVPVGDACALAKAMAQALDHPPERALLRKRASDFDETRALKAYELILLG